MRERARLRASAAIGKQLSWSLEEALRLLALGTYQPAHGGNYIISMCIICIICICHLHHLHHSLNLLIILLQGGLAGGIGGWGWEGLSQKSEIRDRFRPRLRPESLQLQHVKACPGLGGPHEQCCRAAKHCQQLWLRCYPSVALHKTIHFSINE